MTSASLRRLLKFDIDSHGAPRKQRRRLLIHPLLERLEDRTVPFAVANFTGPINPALAAFGPTPDIQPGFFQNQVPEQEGGSFNSGASNVVNPLASASAVNSLGQVSSLSLMFGIDAVNSTDQSNLLRQPWNVDAWGFGSGVQTGQPWAPAYQDVGLANQQGTMRGSLISYTPGGGGNGVATGNNRGGLAPGMGGPNQQRGGGGIRPPENGGQGGAGQKNEDLKEKGRLDQGPKQPDQKEEGQKNETMKKAPSDQRQQERNPQPQGERKRSGDHKEQRLEDKKQEDRVPVDKRKGAESPREKGPTSHAAPLAPIDTLLLRGHDLDAASMSEGSSFSESALLSGAFLFSAMNPGPLSALFQESQGQRNDVEGFSEDWGEEEFWD